MRNIIFALLFVCFGMSSVLFGQTSQYRGQVVFTFLPRGSSPQRYDLQNLGVSGLDFTHGGVNYRVGISLGGSSFVVNNPVQLVGVLPGSLSQYSFHPVAGGPLPAGVSGELISANYSGWDTWDTNGVQVFYDVVFNVTTVPNCGFPNCTACCACTCTGTNPAAHGPCDGTDGPGGCSCHGNGGDDGDDDDGGDDPQCDCGACCRCKCTCGRWPWNNFCLGTCYHVCPFPDFSCPCRDVGLAHEYVHCECHHEEDEDDDEEDEDCDCEDGECCEHHDKIVEELEKIRSELEKTATAADPGALQPPGQFSNPGGISSGVNTSVGLPSGSLNFESPSSGNGKSALRFFERPALGELPEFDTETIFNELTGKFSNKIPIGKLGGLSGGGGGGGGGDWNWKWEIDFTWYGQRMGPWEFDVKPHVDNFAQSNIGGWIRLLVLFYIGTVFTFSVCGLFFDVA